MKRYVVRPTDLPISKFYVRPRFLPLALPTTADVGDGRGHRDQYHETREAADRAARVLNGEPLPAAERLAKLEADIAALEHWHHMWRLTHDRDYREVFGPRTVRQAPSRPRYLEPELSDDERQAATRRMAAWAKESTR